MQVAPTAALTSSFPYRGGFLPNGKADGTVHGKPGWHVQKCGVFTTEAMKTPHEGRGISESISRSSTRLLASTVTMQPTQILHSNDTQ